MNSGLKVITADTSHVEALSEIGAATFVEAYAVTLSVEDLDQYVAEAFSPGLIRDEIEQARACYLLCVETQGGVCGYSKHIATAPPACVAAERPIELQRLYITGDYRGRGIGGGLARRGESIVKEQGYAAIWLQVWEGNTAAQQIYLRWNYTFCGEQMYTVGSAQRNVLIMTKSLV